MKNNYTPKEAGTLITDFRTVAENIVPMREDIAEIKTRPATVESDVKYLKDGFRVSIPSLSKRVSIPLTGLR